MVLGVWDEGRGVGGMFTPPAPPLAQRNLTHVAHDIANGLKVARATELAAVTPLATLKML